MPRVSSFYGIVIAMFGEAGAAHQVPHFHARYGGQRASIGIDPLTLLAGDLPPRMLGMVFEWGAMHRTELMDNWELLRSHQHPRSIEAPSNPFDERMVRMDLVDVVGVEVLDRYQLRLTFSDGVTGDIDLESWLWGDAFEPLRDLSFFRQVRVDPELGTVTWPNGADFDPEGLRASIDTLA